MSNKEENDKVIIKKLNDERIVGANIHVASSFFSRFKGLMLRKRLEQGEGLLLTKTKQIHTFWMLFPIDVLFLKKTEKDQYKIVAMKEKMKPWRIGKYIGTATDVLELAPGAIASHQIKIGEIIKKVMK